MTDHLRPTVYVTFHSAGWWDIRSADGTSLAQHTSEFTAREAGRVYALHLRADLVIRQAHGPDLCERYDAKDGTLKQAVSGPTRGEAP